MRRFLVVVQVILVVAGLGLGGYVGYRAYKLMGKDHTGQLQSYLIFAILALLLIAAAGVVRPREDAEQPLAAPAPQRRAPNQPPFPPGGGYRPGGPPTGPQPPVIGGGPPTGPQPPIGGDYPGRQEQFPGRPSSSQGEPYPGRPSSQGEQY
jgi:hypothetical protein